MRFSTLSFIICLSLSTSLQAQRIENVKATVENDKVIITYDVTGVTSGQRFKAQLFSSHNNFSSPLFRVSGDVGEITPGIGKRIEWDAKAELATFSGDITFEVRGQPVTVEVRATEEKKPVWAFKMPSGKSSIRRGKNNSIEWTGGTPSDDIKIELMRHGKVLQKIADAKNSGSYSWAIPKNFEKGAGFQLKVSSGSESATSATFEVKTKYPLWLKIAPVVVVGGVIAILGGGGGKKTSSGGDLPIPPEPSN